MNEPRRLVTGSELRRLFALRSRLRDAIVGAPRTLQRDVLQALEEARQARQQGRSRPWTRSDMAGDELVREIKWRLDVAALSDVTAAANVLDRARRQAVARARQRNRSGA